MRITWFLLLSVSACVTAGDAGSSPDPSRWEAEIRAFEDWGRKNSVPDDAVLFTGSSSIVGWPTSRDFPQLFVINRGFGGSHISDVNYFFARIVSPYEPKVLVLYAGDNDVADGKSAERVFDDYQAFVKLVRDKLPQTQVVFISIKPSLARRSFWPRMRQANSMIRGLSARHRDLYFADIATPMLGARGHPRAELLAEDGLHLSASGYRLWTSVVAPLIEQALVRQTETEPPVVTPLSAS